VVVVSLFHEDDGGSVGDDMHSEQTLTDLVGLVYDAAMDPRRWIPLLERFERTLRAPFCVFRLESASHQTCNFVANIGFEPAYLRSYRDYYVSRNIFMIDAATRRSGSVNDDRVVSRRTLLKSEFYNDWLAPQGAGFGLNANVEVRQPVTSLLTLIRGRADEPFDQNDSGLLRRLMPHLQRAVHLHQRVVDLQVRTAAAHNALDAWPLGVVVLDGDGRLLLMNQVAEKIVRRGDGLMIDAEGRLRGNRSDETARLAAVVRSTIRPRSGKGAAVSDVVNLQRRRDATPLSLLIAPLSLHRTVLSDPRGTTVVFIGDPYAEPETDETLMRRLYGFTAAEARLAALLIRGSDVNTSAESLGVTRHTARTQLRRLLEKTNSRRQSEFLRLVMQGPLAVRLRS
jgi:DNA-binding CsgD family transcriptional regulator/PAS domain-containing protein